MLNINWQELFSEKSWFIGVDAATGDGPDWVIASWPEGKEIARCTYREGKDILIKTALDTTHDK
jgi:hypothetical protein